MKLRHATHIEPASATDMSCFAQRTCERSNLARDFYVHSNATVKPFLAERLIQGDVAFQFARRGAGFVRAAGARARPVSIGTCRAFPASELEISHGLRDNEERTRPFTAFQTIRAT